MSEARRADRPEIRRFGTLYGVVGAVVVAAIALYLAGAMQFPRIVTGIIGALLAFTIVGLAMRERTGTSTGGGDSAVARLVDRAVGEEDTQPRVTLLALRTTSGTTLPLDGVTIVGRNPDASRHAGAIVRLPGNPTTVSKSHAALEPAAGGVLVTDLGSTNGTSYQTPDGVVPIRPGVPTLVPAGSVLTLGTERLEIVRV